jgi:Ca2+-binding EF-hand superfamily protein
LCKSLLTQEISTEDEKRLKKLFSKLDRNDDGQICIKVLAKLFWKLRLVGSAEVFMARADDNGDKLLNFSEFASYMLEHEHNLKLVFKLIDTNKDGTMQSRCTRFVTR